MRRWLSEVRSAGFTISRVPRRFYGVLLIALAGAIVSCGEVRTTGPGRSGTGTSVIIPKPANPIVGKWSFARYFVDDQGFAHLSQTVWDFASSGAVTRTLYTDNISAGVGDVITLTGKWVTLGNTLEVTFAGNTTPTRYQYHFEGSSLVIAGTSFIRLTQ